MESQQTQQATLAIAHPKRAPSIIKTIVGVLIILGGLSITTYSLLFLIKKSGDVSYYKHVNELTAKDKQPQGKTIQLHGFVAEKSLVTFRTNNITYQFLIENCGQSVLVTYTGTIPDPFKENAEVVVRGTFDSSGIFKATQITAKCPSKYQQTPSGMPTPHCSTS